ncbi:MAG: hypothetical protein Q9160_003312 [Pyrenula sp. 1 TL-2023]
MAGIARKEFSNDSSQTQVDSPSSNTSIEHQNSISHSVYSTSQQSVDLRASVRRKRNARLANPLKGIEHDKLRIRGENYARKHGITEDEDVRAFRLGAILAQNPEQHADIQDFTGEEQDILQKELANRWHQPKEMYLVIVLCSICAATQGADESVVNGAQFFYSEQFSISGDGLKATWYANHYGNGRHRDAYEAASRVRYNKIQAARDVFYMHYLLEAESMNFAHNKVKEMVTVPRNRRALIASEVVMFMQQVVIYWPLPGRRMLSEGLTIF